MLHSPGSRGEARAATGAEAAGSQSASQSCRQSEEGECENGAQGGLCNRALGLTQPSLPTGTRMMGSGSGEVAGLGTSSDPQLLRSGQT